MVGSKMPSLLQSRSSRRIARKKGAPNNVSSCVLRLPHLPPQNELDEFHLIRAVSSCPASKACSSSSMSQHFHFRTPRIILRARGKVPVLFYVLSLTLCCFFAQIILLLNTILWLKMFFPELCTTIEPLRLLLFNSCRVMTLGPGMH